METDWKALAEQGADRALPRLLDLLGAVCAPDSGTGIRSGNRAVINALRPLLGELGAQVEEVPDPEGCHLVARLLPPGKPEGRLLLMAHLDTVFPEGSAAAHPLHREGDWIYGLGAGDCKSGALIALFGALILKEAGQLPPWELTFLFNCDEEIGSPSGQRLFAREAAVADWKSLSGGAQRRAGAGAPDHPPVRLQRP